MYLEVVQFLVPLGSDGQMISEGAHGRPYRFRLQVSADHIRSISSTELQTNQCM